MGREISQISALLQKGVREAVFPGAVLVVGHRGKPVFSEKAGFRSLNAPEDVMTLDTVFDLASITKPLATALAVMLLVDHGSLDLDQDLGELLGADWPDEKRILSARMLLNHTSGFPDWKPYYLELTSRPQDSRISCLRKRLANEVLIYSPGKEVLYSDLGFMILEWLIERVSHMSLKSFLCHHFQDFFSDDKLFLGGIASNKQVLQQTYAATENCPWRKKVLRGEVHDENAFALGGFSGHAGLFGTAKDVFALLNMVREHYLEIKTDHFSADTVRTFLAPPIMPAKSTWVLGWDTPSVEHSSAGRYFSNESVGHLGFTGTSIWMDLKRDVMVVFLTNRIHPTRSNEKIKQFRPLLHNAVMEVLGLT